MFYLDTLCVQKCNYRHISKCCVAIMKPQFLLTGEFQLTHQSINCQTLIYTLYLHIQQGNLSCRDKSFPPGFSFFFSLQIFFSYLILFRCFFSKFSIFFFRIFFQKLLTRPTSQKTNRGSVRWRGWIPAYVGNFRNWEILNVIYNIVLYYCYTIFSYSYV